MTRVLEDLTGHPPTYLRTAPDFHAEPLNDTISRDVAVVGGGYTGLSTALHCATPACPSRCWKPARSAGVAPAVRSVRLCPMPSTSMRTCCTPLVPSMAIA